jgi:hypothetical protein
MAVVMLELLLLMMTTTATMDLSSIKQPLAMMTIKTAVSMPPKKATMQVGQVGKCDVVTMLAMMIMTTSMIVR